MADILWLRWQVQHIERRHGVTARQFQEAWDDPDREEVAEEENSERGFYFRSIGSDVRRSVNRDGLAVAAPGRGPSGVADHGLFREPDSDRPTSTPAGA